MIFIGDIACPDEKVEFFISEMQKQEIFKDEIVVFNLEGNILEKEEEKRPITLYNSPDVIKAFDGARKIIVSLANNHMYDYPHKILSTKNFLEKYGCGVFGISDENGETRPYEYEEGGIKYAFFGHCWRLYTHTNRNKGNDIHISDSFYDEFEETVVKYINCHKDTKVYCFMHWNYDRESLVMPMHRKLAKALIDAGVDGVIGGHSHRPQGAEEYKGKPIVYGLGNFYLPSRIFFNGKLNYPAFCKETYGLLCKENEHKLIWFSTDKESLPIEYLLTENFAGDKISSFSPFREMADVDYLCYFKFHRSKFFLVPVFDGYQGKSYKMKECFAIMRVKTIRLILRLFKYCR